MGNLLFSPSGRIGPSAYMKGIIILAVIGFVLQILPALSPALAMLGLLGVVLFYCFIALGIKRSHDAGKSGWMVLTHILLSWGVAAVTGFVTQMITGVSLGDVFGASMSGDLETVEAIQAQTTSMGYLLPASVMSAVGMVVSGYLINMFNKQDAGDNQFGPVPAA